MDDSELVPAVPEVAPDHFERDLLNRMRAQLPARPSSSVPYRKSVANMDWDKVAFGEHSADECRQRWAQIESRLRVHRTLPELLEDALASRWDPNRLRRSQRERLCTEGAPARRPPSAFLMFCSDTRAKLTKKNPALTPTELMTLLGRKYAELPRSKADKYRERATAAMEEYKEKMAEFRKSHPELAVEEPPKRPRSAFELFFRKHPELERRQARTAFRALSPAEMSRFIVKAQRARQKYDKAVEAYKELYPGWEPPKIGAAISRKQLKIVDEADGVVPKPKTAYMLFVKDVAPTVDVPGPEKLGRCGELWRAADAETRARYAAAAEQEKARYREYVSSLPPDKRQQLESKQRKRRQPRPKKVTAKEAFVRDKMPQDFSALSESEWRRLLLRKFSKLSDADKAVYARRAAELTEEAAAALTNGQHSDAERAEPAGGPPDTKERLRPDDRSPLKRVEAVDDLPVPDEPASSALDGGSPRKKKRRHSRSAADEAGDVDVTADASFGADVTADASLGADVTVNGAAEADQEASTPREFFVRRYVKDNEDTGESEKRLRKKAKKAWNTLSDGARARVEKLFAAQCGAAG